MKTIKVEKLTQEAFAPFGAFANLVNPDADKIGQEPVEFYRDMVQLHVSPEAMLSYSTTRCVPRPFIIDTLEFHSGCWEANLPLDNDIILQVAPASGKNDPLPLDKMRAFLIPQGTLFTIKAGIWHWGPFAMNGRVANVMVNLPERTYVNDCTVVELAEEDRIEITF